MDAVRAPAVSGRFYPGERAELERAVREMLAATDAPAPAPVRVVVVPHAGYAYSGVTAAHVFARVALPRVVVVLAPNHTGAGHATALWERGSFRTPLGDAPVDEAFSAALLDACALVATDHDAHHAEHAVEVEIPFLQMRRPDVAIVPLVLAWDRWDAARTLGDALAALVRRWPEPVLILASSDLNHYEPAAVSERKDARALAAVTALDGEELLARCRHERITMCGRGPTAAALAAARALGATGAEVVDYRHSGWVTGDESAVVGYAGVVIP